VTRTEPEMPLSSPDAGSPATRRWAPERKEQNPLEIWPGKAFPLGAFFDGVGTNFSVFSEVAERVELCLFNRRGDETRVDLPEATGFCWHGYVPRVKPGQRYGYRVHGPWDPAKGLRCNPANLLLDPYAKAIDGTVAWSPEVFAHRSDDPMKINSVDSASAMARSVVTIGQFDWGNDRRLQTPWEETIVYELHVKGFTRGSPRRSAARTAGWPTRPRSSTWSIWASRRSS